MAELIDKWDVVSKLITLENEYQFFKGSEYALDAEKLYRRICDLEIGIAKTQCLELVRCKDCKNNEECSIQDAMNWTPRTEIGDAFCSYGERKDHD